jgi:hypothetical protein
VTFEERMAERQAQQAPLKEGRVSGHGPAKFLFVTLIALIVIVHVGALIVMRAMGMR